MSRRTERIAHLIRRILAEGIQTRLSDPRIPLLTSVTRVELSPDLASAHVHVSVRADAVKQELCIRALRHAAGRLRSLVAAEVSMRQVPWLTFHLDESVRRGSEMVEQLDRLMREAGHTPSLSVEGPVGGGVVEDHPVLDESAGSTASASDVIADREG